MRKKYFKSIVLFFIYVSLIMNAFSSGFDDNIAFGEVEDDEDNGTIKYHLLPGLYRYAPHNKLSGYGIDGFGSDPPSFEKFMNPNTKNDRRDQDIFVKEFKLDSERKFLYGKNEMNQKWYLIWKEGLNSMQPAANLKEDFERVSKNYGQFIIANQTLNHQYQTLNNKYQALSNNHQTLNEKHQTLDNNYQTLKWYGMFSVGIFILALVVMLVYTLVSEDSNIPKKFKAKDRVKVRNTNQQKWRIGEVVQALMVRVDGWEKAHTWNYVEKVEEDTERQDEETDDDIPTEDDDIPTEDSLLCSSMSNTLEKSTTDGQNSESHHTMNANTKAREKHTQSRECTEEHEEKSKSLSFTQENMANDTNTQSDEFNPQKK